jgi:hypothetical protein
MLANFDIIEEQSLLEALIDYCFLIDLSFGSIRLEAKNQLLFESVKKRALDFNRPS